MFYLDAHFALYLTIIAATNARESISLKRHQLVQKQNGQQKQKNNNSCRLLDESPNGFLKKAVADEEEEEEKTARPRKATKQGN